MQVKLQALPDVGQLIANRGAGSNLRLASRGAGSDLRPTDRSQSELRKTFHQKIVVRKRISDKAEAKLLLLSALILSRVTSFRLPYFLYDISNVAVAALAQSPHVAEGPRLTPHFLSTSTTWQSRHHSSNKPLSAMVLPLDRSFFATVCSSPQSRIISFKSQGPGPAVHAKSLCLGEEAIMAVYSFRLDRETALCYCNPVNQKNSVQTSSNRPCGSNAMCFRCSPRCCCRITEPHHSISIKDIVWSNPHQCYVRGWLPDTKLANCHTRQPLHCHWISGGQPSTNLATSGVNRGHGVQMCINEVWTFHFSESSSSSHHSLRPFPNIFSNSFFVSPEIKIPMKLFKIIGLVASVNAFPRLDKRSEFDASKQCFDFTSGKHKFVPPGPKDLRGPCPGLNALANQ